MQISLGISAAFNIAFLGTGWLIWKRARAAEVFELSSKKQQQTELMDAQHVIKLAQAEYRLLASAVSDCIKAVRRDIDRNYCHVHDGQVLDRLAFEIDGASSPVRLDTTLETAIRDAGGGQFITDGVMQFSGRSGK